MLDSGAPVGMNPMKVACLMSEPWPRTKSSAVSVSNSPVPDGLDKVPIKPSGVPVLNNKAALAGRKKIMTHASTMSVFCTTVPPIGRPRIEVYPGFCFAILGRIDYTADARDRILGIVLCAPVQTDPTELVG